MLRTFRYACLPACLALPLNVHLAAQKTAPKDLEFDVVSIKFHRGATNMSRTQSYPNGRWVAENTSAISLISSAFRVDAGQIAGAPPWASSETFDIQATAPPEGADRAVAIAELKLRLQALLKSRFRFAFHEDLKEAEGYALVVSKRGLKMKVSKDPTRFTTNTRRGHLSIQSARMNLFAATLSGMIGRPVADESGLTATYDLELDYDPDESAHAANGADISAIIPTTDSLVAALDNQLGLHLERRKGLQTRLIVVDHIEHPSEN